jgi:hypothetical protein
MHGFSPLGVEELATGFSNIRIGSKISILHQRFYLIPNLKAPPVASTETQDKSIQTEVRVGALSLSQL